MHHSITVAAKFAPLPKTDWIVSVDASGLIRVCYSSGTTSYRLFPSFLGIDTETFLTLADGDTIDFLGAKPKVLKGLTDLKKAFKGCNALQSPNWFGIPAAVFRLPAPPKWSEALGKGSVGMEREDKVFEALLFEDGEAVEPIRFETWTAERRTYKRNLLHSTKTETSDLVCFAEGHAIQRCIFDFVAAQFPLADWEMKGDIYQAKVDGVVIALVMGYRVEFLERDGYVLTGATHILEMKPIVEPEADPAETMPGIVESPVIGAAASEENEIPLTASEPETALVAEFLPVFADQPEGKPLDVSTTATSMPEVVALPAIVAEGQSIKPDRFEPSTFPLPSGWHNWEWNAMSPGTMPQGTAYSEALEAITADFSPWLGIVPSLAGNGCGPP